MPATVLKAVTGMVLTVGGSHIYNAAKACSTSATKS